MKYTEQAQTALNRIDESLLQLHNMIKRGENEKALKFMTEGQLKERFEEMQNIITISGTSNMGARGVQNIRPL